jgi:hypothetical protein
LETADLEKDEVSFFWRDEGTRHVVKVEVTLPGTAKACALEVPFNVEHLEDPNYQVYCKAPTPEQNYSFGYPAEWVNPHGESDTYDVLDSHERWHQQLAMPNGEKPVGSAPEDFWGEPRNQDGSVNLDASYNGSAFLEWHKGFLDAHYAWRETFGLGAPGNPPSEAPAKPEYLKRMPAPVPPPMPDEIDLGKSNLYGYVRLGEFQDLDQLGRDTNNPWHGRGHGDLSGVGGFHMTFLTSPAAYDDTFWKWHGRVDTVREAWTMGMTDQAVVQTTLPVDGTMVAAVNSVTVNFDLPVSCISEMSGNQGGLNQVELRPELLQVNGSPATAVELNYPGSGPKTYKSYIFSGFNPPASGQVTITLTGTPSFAGETWTVTRSP